MRPAAPGDSGRACAGKPRAARRAGGVRARLLAGWLGLALLGGCTPLGEFIQNGFKVGPNYQRPPAPLAPAWIDANNPRVKSAQADMSAWWGAFGDPVLDDLVRTAYRDPTFPC